MKLLSIILLTLFSNTDAILASQRSTFDIANASLALDNDVTTCSRTGFDTGPWWKVDLGVPIIVNGLDIIGGPNKSMQRLVTINTNNTLLNLHAVILQRYVEIIYDSFADKNNHCSQQTNNNNCSQKNIME